MVVLLMDPQPFSLLGRIREQLHELSPAERQLSEFVLDFQGKLGNHSASEVAKSAKVSGATVSRLVRRLGYKNYDEARRQSRVEHGVTSPANLPESGGLGLVEISRLQSHANLTTSFSRLSDTVVSDIAQTILISRKLKIVGLWRAE